jgi:drug/metabolite transporter (DMT)-like permease
VLPVIPLVGVPRAAAWPWIVASVIFHLGYFIGLTEAYRTGDMGQVYPIARGSAPLMTAIVSTVIVGEKVGLLGWLGILILVSGVFLLSIRGGRDLHFDKRAVAFALFTAVTICGYSIVDGIGARTAQDAHAYTVWLFLLDGLMMLVFVLLRRGAAVLGDFGTVWKSGLIGGTLSLAAYWIAIWAMTVAPIALVAALRETSVLFAAAIAVIVLKEPLQRPRVIAALMIVIGLVLIRLQ